MTIADFLDPLRRVPGVGGHIAQIFKPFTVARQLVRFFQIKVTDEAFDEHQVWQ